MINSRRMRYAIKIIAYSFWLIFMSYSISLAQQGWDSTYRPEIYASRVDLFRSFEHSKKDIVFLGNSIIFWGEWPELLRNNHIRNRGIPGDNTFGVLERLDEVINGKPAKIFILIGINDIARNIPDSVILGNYKKMIARIQSASPRTKIYFQTIMPTNGSFQKLTNYYDKDEHIGNVNAGLKQLAASYSIPVIDLYSLFADSTGHLFKELSFDGVHLTKNGYDKWKELLINGNYLK